MNFFVYTVAMAFVVKVKLNKQA